MTFFSFFCGGQLWWLIRRERKSSYPDKSWCHEHEHAIAGVKQRKDDNSGYLCERKKAVWDIVRVESIY